MTCHIKPLKPIVAQIATWQTSYEVQFRRYGVRQFFVILGYFYPFTNRNNPDDQNIEKIKKASGDVILLNLRKKNQSYDMCLLRYGVQQV